MIRHIILFQGQRSNDIVVDVQGTAELYRQRLVAWIH